MASNPDPGAGGRAARCAAACKYLDNDHAAAAARARQASSWACAAAAARLPQGVYGIEAWVKACIRVAA